MENRTPRSWRLVGLEWLDHSFVGQMISLLENKKRSFHNPNFPRNLQYLQAVFLYTRAKEQWLVVSALDYQFRSLNNWGQ